MIWHIWSHNILHNKQKSATLCVTEQMLECEHKHNAVTHAGQIHNTVDRSKSRKNENYEGNLLRILANNSLSYDSECLLEALCFSTTYFEFLLQREEFTVGKHAVMEFMMRT